MTTSGTKNTGRTVAKIITAALAVLLVLLIVALIVNLVRLGAENDRADALKAQDEQLKAIIAENEKLAKYYDTSEFVESYAREYLDMIYRGETVIGGK